MLKIKRRKLYTRQLPSPLGYLSYLSSGSLILSSPVSPEWNLWALKFANALRENISSRIGLFQFFICPCHLCPFICVPISHDFEKIYILSRFFYFYPGIDFSTNLFHYISKNENLNFSYFILPSFLGIFILTMIYCYQIPSPCGQNLYLIHLKSSN